MKPKTTVILLIVFALSGAAFFLTRDDDGTGHNAGPDPSSANAQDKAIVPEDMLGIALSRIMIDDANRSALVIDRSEGKWNLFSPHQFPARTKAIDELLQLLAGLEGTEIDEAYDMLGDYVGLVTSDSNEIAISLGPRLGSGRAVLFVREADETKTYNASDSLHDYLDQLDPKAFFGKKLPKLLMPDIRMVRIDTPEGSSVLRQTDSKWWIGEGEQAERALEQSIPDYPGISDYFSLFEVLEVLEIQTYNGDQGLAQFGLDKPLASAHFTPVSQKNPDWGWQLKVGVPADPQDQTRFVSYGWFDDPTPTVFTAATPIALAFALDASVFLDPRVMTIPISLIESMTIKNPKGHFTIRFMPNGIHFVTSGPDFTPNVTPQDTKDGATLAEVLSNVRVIEFNDQDIAGLEPVASIVINPKLDGDPEVLEVFPDTVEATVLIRIDNEKKLRRVKRSSVQMLIEKNFLDTTP